jgi:two-component system cell cycle sensor histidine kinase/response regulator CckA
VATRENATVLLVEDDATVRAAIRRGLQSSGFAVLEAADGEAGLAIALNRGRAIDVLITDLMMPGMNGRELSDAVRDVYPEMLVVFISGYADDTVDTRSLTDERHSYLAKPFSSPQLRATIQQLMATNVPGTAAHSA